MNSILPDFLANLKRLLRGERATPPARCLTCGEVVPPGGGFVDDGGRTFCGAEHFLFRPALLRRAR